MHSATVQVPASARRADRLPRLWQWAGFAGVIGAHLFWLVLALRPLPPIQNERSARMDPPRIAFMGDPVAGTDARLLHSPVLFSLPTSIGFSGPLLAAAGTAEPPVTLPPEPPRLRTPAEPFAAPAFGASARTLTDLVAAPRPLPVPLPDTAEFPAVAGDAGPDAFTVYWPDRPDQPRESISADGAEAWAGRNPWDMVLYICFDADGLIRQVMVEKASPYQDVTAAVLRIARGMVFGAPIPGQCGRLVVVYQPPPARRE
jgi:hypothetical protein